VVESGVVSNFATLPVASSGRTCSDPINPFTATVLNDLSENGSFSYGFIDIGKSDAFPDNGAATFARMSAAEVSSGQYANALGQVTSFGSCNVYTFITSSTPTAAIVENLPKVTYLNAGSVIDIGGPGGTTTPMNQDAAMGVGVYATFGACGIICIPSFIPATGGSFTFNNESGGTDVGAFTATLQMPPPIIWSNMNSIASPIQRADGVTVTWTGGDFNTYVQITGISTAVNPGASSVLAGVFTCMATTGAGAFAVPPAVLLSLPPSDSLPSYGLLQVSNYVNPVPFTAPGIDYAFAEGYFSNVIVTAYQ
jgi:hypothetical protein